MLQQPVWMPHAANEPRCLAARGTGGDPLHKIAASSGTAAAHRGKAMVMKVAIVDDEDDLVAVYAIMARSWGRHVESTGGDGTEIVQAFDGKKIQPMSC